MITNETYVKFVSLLQVYSSRITKKNNDSILQFYSATQKPLSANKLCTETAPPLLRNISKILYLITAGDNEMQLCNKLYRQKIIHLIYSISACLRHVLQSS